MVNTDNTCANTLKQLNILVSNPLNDSPLFQSFKVQNFSDAECVQDVSHEHFEEVSCEF